MTLAVPLLVLTVGLLVCVARMLIEELNRL